MLKETLRKIYRAFADGLAGMKDAFSEEIFKRDKKEPSEEPEWWEDEPKDKKPTTWDKIKNIRKKLTSGPRPLPGSQRMKRIMVALMLPVYIGIVLFMLGENIFVEIFFVLTVYILVDYLGITREGDVWVKEG